MKTFLHSLIAAAIGGAIGGASAALSVEPLRWNVVGKAAATAALLTVSALLKQSPRVTQAKNEQE